MLSFSQDWELIDPDQIYYYGRSDSSGCTNTMRVDSVVNDNELTHYYFHDNYIRYKDTCIYYQDEVSGIWFPSDSVCHYYPVNQGSLLGKKVSIDNDANYYFNDNNNLIRPFADLGEEWVYDVEFELTAKVMEISSTFSLGIPDSLKVIHIFENDSILIDSVILSRNNGLHHFPLNDSVYFEETGIQSNMNGDRIPRFEDLYQMTQGDVLVFRHFHSEVVNIGTAGVETTARLEVISVDTLNGHPIFNCSMATRKRYFDYESNIFFSNTISTAEIVFDPYTLYKDAYSFPGEISKMVFATDFMNIGYFSMNPVPQGFQEFGFQLMTFNASMQFGNYNGFNSSFIQSNYINSGNINGLKKVMWKGGNEFANSYPPFVSTASSNMLEHEARIDEGTVATFFYFNNAFQEDFGITYMGQFQFEAGEYIKLIGAKKNNINYGFVPSASVLLSQDEWEEEIIVKTYPNPCGDHIYISNEVLDQLDLRIISSDGRLLGIHQIPFGQIKVDLSTYEDGVLLFQYTSQNNRRTERIIRIN